MESARIDDEVGFPQQFEYLAILISLICSILIIVHAAFPQIAIDTTTITLLIILIFPWLLPYMYLYIKEIKLPGVGGITFRDKVRILERRARESRISQYDSRAIPVIKHGIPSPWYLYPFDSNVALAYLRYVIDGELRQLAIDKKIPSTEGTSLREVIRDLTSKGIIGFSEAVTLDLIIDVCNKAVHARTVDPQTARRILKIGSSATQFLRSKRIRPH